MVIDTRVEPNGYKLSELGRIPKEWNLIELDKVANRITTKNKGTVSTNVLTISAQHGLVSQTEFFNKQVASKNLEGYYLLEKKDFSYNKSYSNGYPMGAIKPLELYEKGVVSSLYICFRFNNELVDFSFIKQYFNSNLWHGEVASIAQEGARNHGLLNVSIKEFFKIKLIIPPLKEQQKIAEILNSIDEQIEKTNQLIVKTKELKKGLMTQLFTYGVGPIRSKKMNLEEIPPTWNIKKIGDIAQVKTGGTPNRAIKEYWDNGSIPWMSSGEINLKKVFEVQEKITTTGFENSNTSLLPIGTVMMAMNGQGKTRGTVALLQVETTCNQSLAGIIPTSGCNNIFLYYYLEYSYEKLRNITGEGRSGLNLSLIKNFEVIQPTLKEQQKIAEILTSIDEKIEIYEKEKEKRIELKKALMPLLLTGEIRATI